MKNLKSLETKGLLKSKSYGLGKEVFWSFTNKKIVRDLGYFASPEVHAHLYEHEKDLADVFVSLALTGQLYEWRGEGNQKEGFRFDRMFRTSDKTYYLERERGTQGREKLRMKLERYAKHYRTTQEDFNVLILAEAGEQEFHLSLFKELGFGNHYATALCSDFIKDPLTAILTTRFGLQSLKESSSK
jgi:hypothetical protein